MPPTDLDDDDLYRNRHFRRFMGRMRMAVAILGHDTVAQEVRVALFHAHRRYDPTHGASFDTYATPFVRVAVARAAYRARRVSRLATKEPQKVYAFVRRVSIEGPVSPSAVREAFPHLRRATDLDMHRVIDWCRDVEVPFDETGRDGATVGEDVVGADADSVEETSHVREACEEIERLAVRVEADDVERVILRDMILADAPKTLKEIGRDVGVTGERIRQKRNKLVARLREELLRSRHPWVAHLDASAA